jgi:hypothetical protein
MGAMSWYWRFLLMMILAPAKFQRIGAVHDLSAVTGHSLRFKVQIDGSAARCRLTVGGDTSASRSLMKAAMIYRFRTP